METILKAALIEARDLLGLGSCASIKNIKAAFRELAKACHPDHAADDPGAQEKMKRINQAYRILLAYCEQFPIPLDEQSLVAHTPEAAYRDHMDRFYGNWFRE